MISVAALLALWVADGVVFVLEYRKERRGPRFWWSFAGLVFLGTLTFSDFKLARLEQRAEQQLAWRRVTAEQRAI
jgi:hypothetical protein